MADYVSIFIAGFEETVMRHIPRELGGAEMLHVGGGLAHYKYAGKPAYVARLPFVNNSFAILTQYRGAGATFEKLVNDSAKKTFRAIGEFKNFRVCFSMENQFEKVPKRLTDLAEAAIIRNCGMYAERTRPECEFWYIIRRDGRNFLGQLLTRQRSGALNGGELRPELACLLCLDCGFGKSAVICDPYAGYGAIPNYVQKYCEYAKLYVNDIDAKLVNRMKKGPLGKDAGVVLTCADAAHLKHIGDASVDFVVTDPPWGFVGEYGDISDFYRRALAELKRIVAVGGRIVLLTGKPSEMAGAARYNALDVRSRLNILVNGKKASVFTLGKR